MACENHGAPAIVKSQSSRIGPGEDLDAGAHLYSVLK
jgi:hypothetical protein